MHSNFREKFEYEGGGIVISTLTEIPNRTI